MSTRLPRFCWILEPSRSDSLTLGSIGFKAIRWSTSMETRKLPLFRICGSTNIYTKVKRNVPLSIRKSVWGKKKPNANKFKDKSSKDPPRLQQQVDPNGHPPIFVSY